MQKFAARGHLVEQFTVLVAQPIGQALSRRRFLPMVSTLERADSIASQHQRTATPGTLIDRDVSSILVRLTSITYAAEGTNLYEFRAIDGSRLPAFEPGAHIDVMLPNGMTRQYSLTFPYAVEDGYVIGVKRDDAGRGGSRYIHERFQVGAQLKIGSPRNHFKLDEGAAHSVLVAGGIGITPIWCMSQRLQKLGRSWELHYSVRTRAEAAFLDETKLLGSSVHLHVDEEQGRYVDISRIVSDAALGAHLYCCGPVPMLDAFKAACAGRPQEYVHFEYFGAAPPTSAAREFVVHLARMGKDVTVPEGVTILDALAGAGVEVPSSCRQGVCGICETRVIDGMPDHRDVILTAEEKKKNQTMMICCSRCVGERIVLDI